MGAIGGYFFKKASGQKISMNLNLFIYLLAGSLFYCAGAVLNIWVLRHLPYTVVFPLTSFTYVWTLAISYFLLDETISIKKSAGVVLIIIGSIFLVR
ncbi:EamA family transporter [Sediminibacillus albus]|nr:EamA family transporter [Sediminibacillus albus]